jgi:uncharacterized protein involved in exopolysaccharide biosynthesis
LIGLITLSTVALAIAALVLIPAKYKATTIVLVDPRQPHVTNTPAVLPGIGADAAAVESQVELIQSPGLASKVIESLRLDEDPEFTAPSLIDPILDAISALLGHDSEAPAKAKATRLIYKFQNGLVVRRRGLTYVIEINYSAKDPSKAARISAP